jgi:hypothetical protein
VIPGIRAAKDIVLQQLRANATVASAMASVGRASRSYDHWLRSDPEFKARVAEIRRAREDARVKTVANPKQMSFADFRRRYLGTETFPHQQNMIDVVEGREPSWMHPMMKYEKADPQLTLINVPPDFAKTITISIDYVTYLLCTDPNSRVVLISKAQELAKQMLFAIKQRLTHPMYADLQRDFGPPDGYKSGDVEWQATRIRFSSEIRDPKEKDPSCQALGLGGQLYGSRSTHIFIDDAVLLSNAHLHVDQRNWITQEVLSRLGDSGKLVVLGTRVAEVDLYRELRNGDNYEDGESPWTYLAMPAVLEFHDKSENWKTLWPRSDQPWHTFKSELQPIPDEDGLYPRWDGPRMARRRAQVPPRTWAMVYQQQDVSSEAIFNPADIAACTNGNRTVGRISGTNDFHKRPEGMDGLYVICAMDPAMAGETATVAYAVDPKTLKRYVLDAHRMRAPSPSAIRDIIYAWTDKYRPLCWMIEKNAFQLFLTRDEDIRQFLANRGCSMQEHYSGNNKLDPDFGVASLGPLFSERMIDLPSSHNSEGMKALREQLVTWRPGAKPKELIQDLPMAMWFAEIKARQVVEQRTLRGASHQQNKYVPRYRRKQQMTINIDEYLREMNA